MAKNYKIVFTGPAGAGKTTAIRTLSDIPVVQTEAAATDQVRQLKPATTVAMDYGMMKLANGDKVNIYGTPGQKRFDFMWDILSQDAQGMVLMINATAPNPVDDLRLFCSHFRPFIDSDTLVVAVTHADQVKFDVTTLLMNELQQQGAAPRVMEVDARQRKTMALLVESLIFSLNTPHSR
jgi:signal recognition particle receptor subunit beta